MAREVTADECLRVSGDPTEFQRMIGQLDPAEDPANKPATPRPAVSNAKR
jgi:hypothetical protein